MARYPFPADIPPTGRTYKPGKIPETVFQAQNGAKSIVAYGQNFVDAELTLTFANIDDNEVNRIIQHYDLVKSGDYVVFGPREGLQGMGEQLIEYLQTGDQLLRWRYADAPQIQSIQLGVSTVQVKFVGILFGS